VPPRLLMLHRVLTALDYYRQGAARWFGMCILR
jgi:hypothetical protein